MEALSLDDSTFAGMRGAGLIAPANSSLEARWDRFLTMEQPPAPEETTPAEPVIEAPVG